MNHSALPDHRTIAFGLVARTNNNSALFLRGIEMMLARPSVRLERFTRDGDNDELVVFATAESLTRGEVYLQVSRAAPTEVLATADAMGRLTSVLAHPPGTPRIETFRAPAQPTVTGQTSDFFSALELRAT